jgi:phenylacetate-CoA ligase
MSKLKDFLGKVYETNEFYRNIAKTYNIANPDDITQYPILTRQQLQENRYNMFSEGYKNKYFSNTLHRQFSSGTSGTPINVYWGNDDYWRSMIALWRKRTQYYGILPNDKNIKFTLNAFSADFTEDIVHNFNATDNTLSINRSFLQTDDSYNKLIAIISDFSPAWLYIQPFLLKKLLYYYQYFNVEPPKSLKYIESLGELLSEKLRKDAIKFFNVPVANMYGSEEMNGIAYECPYNHMHILEDNVFIECKNNKGMNQFDGESIITGLNNIAMPLVRYNQGDIISIEKLKSSCNCGSVSPIIRIIKGRMHDYIQEDGFEINTFLLLEVIDEVNNQFSDPITEYKFLYYKTSKKLMCYIAINAIHERWGNKIIENLYLVFKSKLPPYADISFEIKTYKDRKSVV